MIDINYQSSQLFLKKCFIWLEEKMQISYYYSYYWLGTHLLVNSLHFHLLWTILFYSNYQVKASSAKNCQDFCNIYGDCSTFVFSSQISTAENCDLVSMVSLACTVGLDEIYSRVVRASDSQCRSRNCPGFDTNIHQHSGIWGAADEQCWIR
jgi:hypothetical protein